MEEIKALKDKIELLEKENTALVTRIDVLEKAFVDLQKSSEKVAASSVKIETKPEARKELIVKSGKDFYKVKLKRFSNDKGRVDLRDADKATLEKALKDYPFAFEKIETPE